MLARVRPHAPLAAVVATILAGCASLKHLNESPDKKEYRRQHAEAERQAQAGDLEAVATIAGKAPPRPAGLEHLSIYDVYVRATGAALPSVACADLVAFADEHSQSVSDAANAGVLVARIDACGAHELLFQPTIAAGLRRAGKLEAAVASSNGGVEQAIIAALAPERAPSHSGASAEAMLKVVPTPMPDTVCRAVAGSLDKLDATDRIVPSARFAFLRSLGGASCPERAAAAAGLLADADSSIRAEACTVLGGAGDARYVEAIAEIAANDAFSIEHQRTAGEPYVRIYPVRDACQRAVTRLRLPR